MTNLSTLAIKYGKLIKRNCKKAHGFKDEYIFHMVQDLIIPTKPNWR